MDKWKKHSFGEVAERSKERHNPKKEEEDLKCIELEHLESETGRLLGYTYSHRQKSTKNKFYEDEVLYGKLRPYLKKYYLADFEGVCSSEIWVLRAKKETILNEYLYYLVQTSRFNRFANITSGTKMPRANWSFISETMFKIPPKNEQRKISNIISIWDKGIKLKKELIEEKRKQKKGLMQRLLTGKVRLDGFNEEWKEVKLGKVLEERKERGYEDLELLSITSSEGVIKRSELDKKNTSSSNKSKYKRILPKDIGYNTMRMWQGVCGVSEYEGIVSPAYTILKPTDTVDSYFMGYLFKLPTIINLFRRYSQGMVNDTLNLRYNNFKQIKVTIPTDIEEQREIVKILKLQDKEIELLEQEVEALKEQKKGLMQLLLTGKVRVEC
ncbi:restriction endonuclease subunit S [Natroniella sp. ANB-PHB2]|uniref:restriction endonuclease subunit S n=1 Tax=Natroniella sp. ANB-PHB2 TaxID=3384444 RepID=UPI0038D3CFF3